MASPGMPLIEGDSFDRQVEQRVDMEKHKVKQICTCHTLMRAYSPNDHICRQETASHSFAGQRPRSNTLPTETAHHQCPQHASLSTSETRHDSRHPEADPQYDTAKCIQTRRNRSAQCGEAPSVGKRPRGSISISEMQPNWPVDRPGRDKTYIQ